MEVERLALSAGKAATTIAPGERFLSQKSSSPVGVSTGENTLRDTDEIGLIRGRTWTPPMGIEKRDSLTRDPETECSEMESEFFFFSFL